jgi:hypothetical protein
MFLHFPDHFLTYRESAFMTESLSFERVPHFLETIAYLLDSISDEENLV